MLRQSMTKWVFHPAWGLCLPNVSADTRCHWSYLMSVLDNPRWVHSTATCQSFEMNICRESSNGKNILVATLKWKDKVTLGYCKFAISFFCQSRKIGFSTMQLTLHKDWLKSCQWNLFKTSNTYRQASRKLLFCLRGKKWVVWQKVEFTALIDIRQQNDTATTSSRRLDPRRY